MWIREDSEQRMSSDQDIAARLYEQVLRRLKGNSAWLDAATLPHQMHRQLA